MLRNKNQSAAGKRICGINRVGVLASEIPTGFSAAAFLLNDIDASYPGRFYRVQILTGPSPSGELFLYEDSSGFFSGPDGAYTGTQRVSKYDESIGRVSVEDGVYGFTIGASVSCDLTASYGIENYVSGDLVAAYSIAEQPGLVSTDLVGVYGIGAYVSASLVASYSVLDENSPDPETYARAPAGSGYVPARLIQQNTRLAANTQRPAQTQRNTR